MQIQYNGPVIYQNRTPAYGSNMVYGNAIPQPGGPPPRASPPQVRTIYAQKTTKNKSFLDMHHYHKAIGVQNNDFFLALLDTGLAGIDPRDPHLSSAMKARVLMECRNNYW